MKINKKSLVAIVGIVLVLAVLQANKYYAEVVRPVEEAQKAVITQLKDPNSAEFYNVVAYKNTSSVCGEINAKNVMGGYVGRKRFVYNTLTKTVTFEEPEEDKERLFEKMFWYNLCIGSNS